jgi:hypothetical protein
VQRSYNYLSLLPSKAVSLLGWVLVHSFSHVLVSFIGIVVLTHDKDTFGTLPETSTFFLGEFPLHQRLANLLVSFTKVENPEISIGVLSILLGESAVYDRKGLEEADSFGAAWLPRYKDKESC